MFAQITGRDNQKKELTEARSVIRWEHCGCWLLSLALFHLYACKQMTISTSVRKKEATVF